jgi:oligosaccharide repeat unit polymerase
MGLSTLRKANRSGFQPRTCWWLNPIAIVLCFHLPIILGAHLLGGETYENSWHVPKFLNGETLLLVLATVLAFLLGYGLNAGFSSSKCVSSRKTLRSLYFENRRQFINLFRLSLGLTWLGAAIWTATGVQAGFGTAAIMAFLKGQKYASTAIKSEYFGTTPGITTMTQFGMAAMILGLLIYHFEPRRKGRWPWAIICLVLLDTVRAFMLSERLALLEVIIPAILLLVHFHVTERKLTGFTRTLINVAPVLAVVGVFFLFTGFEMFRSWTVYSATHDSLLMFGFERLIGYYATALNNSALILDRMVMPSHIPFFTFEWLWKMPVLKEVFGRQDFWIGQQYNFLLDSVGNPEYNNPGGFLLPLKDFGVIGGLFCWFLSGIVVSKIYRSFIRNESIGLLMYPMVFMGLLEMAKSLYLNNGRATPSLAILALAIFLCSSSSRRKRAKSSRPKAVSIPETVAR